MSFVCLMVVFLAALAGCQAPSPRAEMEQPSRSSMIEFEGTVRYIDLEGGFYGIETDAGKRLNPTNLPDGLKRNGLTVRGNYVILKESMSIQMWGQQVEVYSVRPYFPNPDWD